MYLFVGTSPSRGYAPWCVWDVRVWRPSLTRILSATEAGAGCVLGGGGCRLSLVAVHQGVCMDAGKRFEVTACGMQQTMQDESRG